jgi:hypothetical protein
VAVLEITRQIGVQVRAQEMRKAPGKSDAFFVA